MVVLTHLVANYYGPEEAEIRHPHFRYFVPTYVVPLDYSSFKLLYKLQRNRSFISAVGVGTDADRCNGKNVVLK